MPFKKAMAVLNLSDKPTKFPIETGMRVKDLQEWVANILNKDNDSDNFTGDVDLIICAPNRLRQHETLMTALVRENGQAHQEYYLSYMLVPKEQFTLKVVAGEGWSCEIRVRGSDNFGRVHAQARCVFWAGQLQFENTILEYNHRVADYRLTNGSVLHWVKPLRIDIGPLAEFNQPTSGAQPKIKEVAMATTAQTPGLAIEEVDEETPASEEPKETDGAA